MYTKRNLFAVVTALLVTFTASAQLFETRTTRFGGNEILSNLQNNGTPRQNAIRDSIIRKSTKLKPNDVIETFFDDHHMGLIIYRDKKPHKLLGFWLPSGKKIWGGSLKNGNGVVRTPFNPSIIQNFKYETVTYKKGMKNGETFYFCDCASVLRKGQFTDNQKEGLWKEFTPKGEFVEQKHIRIEKDPVDIKIDVDDRWKEAAHCMMRNPDEDIKCPTDN